MKSLNTLSVAAVLLRLSTLVQSQWTVGQEVSTSSGTVKGHEAKGFNQVSEYLGIPFATPPVGKLRFMAPEKLARSSEKIVADNFGPDCPSNALLSRANATTANGKPRWSEDCLTLNIWTKPQTGEKKKAVLVWIYGGGFTSGSAANPAYNGKVFADKQDVVVVSINYRVNLFGFPAAPGVPDLNLGLLDQRRAVKWVHKNIAAFGGDSDRITIFGESAGSRSVDIYAYAWAKDPIAHGFIAESGAAPFVSGNKWNVSLWYELSSRLGCGGVDKGNSTVDCVRTKSMQDIVKASAGGGNQPNILNQFTPVVDEKVYFSDYNKRAAAGNFAQKPILIGNNDNETPNLKANLGYICGARFAAQARKDKGIKSWRYRWMGVFPNQRRTPDAGAWHGSEIMHVFGLPDAGGSPIKSTDNQRSISTLMNNAWAKFAKDPEKGLTSLGWPTYDTTSKLKSYLNWSKFVADTKASEDTLILLAANNSGTASFTNPTPFDEQCGLVERRPGPRF